MMYVVCFYWQGDRWQEKGFTDEPGYVNKLQHHLDRSGQIDHSLPSQYVNNLFHGVTRHAKEPFKFVCFTNEELKVDDGVELRPLKMTTRCGVLPRLYMFSEDAGLYGHQVLCLDLDVVITGSLKDLMGYRGLFCTRSKFDPKEAEKLDGDIMSFKAGAVAEHIFWKPFIENVDRAVEYTQGRERYWVRFVASEIADTWQDLFPGQVLSYKWHVKRKRAKLDNARIVSCHGYPRPHQIKDKIITDNWR